MLVEWGISKADCLRILSDAGITLPAMYALGFDHNNCVGCVKSTSAGYWNRVRRLFPDVFARRAAQSRAIGVRLVRVRGERVYLDALPVDAQAPDDDIDCGPVCQAPSTIPVEACGAICRHLGRHVGTCEFFDTKDRTIP